MFVKLRLLAVLILFTLSGCQSLFRNIMGIDHPVSIDKSEIVKIAHVLNIPKEKCFLIDTSIVSALVKMNGNAESVSLKNHLQPLQVLYFYFSSEADIISYKLLHRRIPKP